MFNSANGLITVLINVYTAQGGVWSTTAKVALALTSVFTFLTMLLSISYKLWIEVLKIGQRR